MLDETTGERIERRLEHEKAGVIALDISPDRYFIVGRFREARNQISNSYGEMSCAECSRSPSFWRW